MVFVTAQATGALPIVRTLPPTNLVWDASRRRLNRAALDVAARTRVPLVRLDAFVEHVLEQGARRVGVAVAYAFVEVRWPAGGVRGLGAACSEPLTFGAARRLPNATWRRPTLALEAYGDVNRRPRCLGAPYAMTDGAHFSRARGAGRRRGSRRIAARGSRRGIARTPRRTAANSRRAIAATLRH